MIFEATLKLVPPEHMNVIVELNSICVCLNCYKAYSCLRDWRPHRKTRSIKWVIPMFTQDHMERIIPMLCVQNISYVPGE